MPRGRRPAVGEILGNFAGRHPAIAFAKREQDLPPRPVRKSGENRVGDRRFCGSGIGFRRHVRIRKISQSANSTQFLFLGLANFGVLPIIPHGLFDKPRDWRPRPPFNYPFCKQL